MNQAPDHDKLKKITDEMDKLRTRSALDPKKRIRNLLAIQRSALEVDIYNAEVALERQKVHFNHVVNQHQLVVSALEGLQVWVEVRQDIAADLLIQNKIIDFYEHFEVIKKNGKFRAINVKPSFGTYLFFIDQQRLVLVDKNVDSSD